MNRIPTEQAAVLQTGPYSFETMSFEAFHSIDRMAYVSVITHHGMTIRLCENDIKRLQTRRFLNDNLVGKDNVMFIAPLMMWVQMLLC